MLIGDDSDTLYYQEMERRIHEWNDIHKNGTYFGLPIQFSEGFDKKNAYLVNKQIFDFFYISYRKQLGYSLTVHPSLLWKQVMSSSYIYIIGYGIIGQLPNTFWYLYTFDLLQINMIPNIIFSLRMHFYTLIYKKDFIYYIFYINMWKYI